MLIGDLLDDGAATLGRGLAALAVAAGVLLSVAVLVILVLTITVSAISNPTVLAGGAPLAAHPLARPDIPPRAKPVLAASMPGAVTVARNYLGVRYVFGGSDPAVGLDCSGLVQLVFRQLGFGLPRTAQLQFQATSRVSREQLQPGDLVFFARTYADAQDWITHVGIYIGDGLQINAPTEGQVVSIQPVFSGFWGAHFAGGGRVAPA